MSTSRSLERPRFLCLGVLTVAVLGTTPGIAAAAADCFAVAECSALAGKGKQAHNERRYDDALRSYQAAYDRVADPRLLLLRGRSLFKQGHPDRALDLYRAAFPQLSDDGERKDAAEFIRQAEAALHGQGVTSQSVAAAPNGQLSSSKAGFDPQVGVVAAPSSLIAAPGGQRQPAYKRWWFWTIVGVSVAAAATGIALGIAAREPDTTGLMEYHP